MLTFSDEELDLTDALHVYVTLKQDTKTLTKQDTELIIESKRIEFELSQTETLAFMEGPVKVQANATYAGVFSSSNATNAGATCVRFKSKTQLSIYINTSSYGLLPNQDYEYFIVYSE